MDRDSEMQIGRCLSSLYAYVRYYIMQSDIKHDGKSADIADTLSDIIYHMEDSIIQNIKPIGYSCDMDNVKKSYIYVYGDYCFESQICKHDTSVMLGYYDAYSPQSCNVIHPSLTMPEIISTLSENKTFSVLMDKISIKQLDYLKNDKLDIKIDKNEHEPLISDKDTPEQFIRKMYNSLNCDSSLHTESKGNITYAEFITDSKTEPDGFRRESVSFAMNGYDIIDINEHILTRTRSKAKYYDIKVCTTHTPTDVFLVARHNPDCAKLLLSVMRERDRREEGLSRSDSNKRSIFCSIEENIQNAFKKASNNKHCKQNKGIEITFVGR